MKPLSVRALHTQIAEQHTTVDAAVSGCLKNIAVHNPLLNAVVTTDNEQIAASVQAAKAWQTCKKALPPLFGIPVTVKDVFATQNLRTTAGFEPLRDYMPQENATVVARLKAASAIILGKTNTSPLAGDVQTDNTVFGRTCNPFNPELTCGGSSGGSAAAVVSGMSYLDVGSDLGGLIRLPAHFCGAVGFKASENRIPRSGHIPHLPTGERSVWHMLSLGVLARYVDDARIALGVLAGADGKDSTVPALISAATPPIERPLRLACWDDFDGLPLCRRTRAAWTQSIEHLRAAGFTVEKRKPQEWDFHRAWAAYGEILGVEMGLGLPRIQRFLLSCLKPLLSAQQPLTRAFVSGLRFQLRRYNHALNERERLIEALETFLCEYDAWLCPVAPTAAFPHSHRGALGLPPKISVDGKSLPYLEGVMSIVVPFSLTGSPVISLPCGLQEGLPVGIQIIGRRWHDETLLDVAERIEKVWQGFVPPPLNSVQQDNVQAA